MGRKFRAISGVSVCLLGLISGCKSPISHEWNWPWTKKPQLTEEIVLPPENDPRFSNPPTYPKSVMGPKLRTPPPTDPRAMPRNPGMPTSPTQAGAFR